MSSSASSGKSSKNSEEESALQEDKLKSSLDSEVVVKKSQTRTTKKTTPKKKSYSETEQEESDESADEVQNMRVEEEENVYKNLDNMSLRNYFQDRIEELDPPLIVKQKIGQYSIYSKVCQSHQKRQPIILTDEELNKIKKAKVTQASLAGFLDKYDLVIE